MTQETQDRLLSAVEQIVQNLCDATGQESFSYEQSINFLRSHSSITVAELALNGVKSWLPGIESMVSLKPHQFPAILDDIDTREKATAICARMPEPDPRLVAIILKAADSFLPNIRKNLLPFAKSLPHSKGGRGKIIPDPEDRQKVRDEVALLTARGVKVADAQGRIAQRWGVKVRTIETIWKEKSKLHLDRPEIELK